MGVGMTQQTQLQQRGQGTEDPGVDHVIGPFHPDRRRTEGSQRRQHPFLHPLRGDSQGRHRIAGAAFTLGGSLGGGRWRERFCF